MFNLGATELIVLLGLGILLFGHKLPSVARSLGRSVVSFQQGLKGIEDDIESSMRETPAVQAPRPPQKVESAV